MAIFRDGVKIGNMDIRTGLSKQRGQGILRKLKILPDDKGRKKFEQDAMGEVQTIRTIVAKSEGFTMPVNFKVEFQAPRGIEHASGSPHGDSPGAGKVKTGSLEWKTHLMNNSTVSQIKAREKQAQMPAHTQYNPTGGDKDKQSRDLQKLNLYCSKVTLPEKTINVGLYRHYGASFAFPQSIQYGTITTTFYCDGTMHIKNYFDAWQKLIYNDITGNFNFYKEYISEFDIFTRTTVAAGARIATDSDKEDGLVGDIREKSTAISDAIKEGTKKFNEMTGVDSPRDKSQAKNDIPKIVFRENYGVKIFECFPQTVGQIELAHDATDSIATFDVTWAYSKWNPFMMGNVGRQTINLAIGEFRNEKDGFPFIEDLPPELSGPLTGAIGQGAVTSPLSKASNLLG